MYKKGIIINCPGCEAEIECNPLAGGMQCPFCDKKFNVEDGKRTRELLMQRQFIKEENINTQIKVEKEVPNVAPVKAKYCEECGRKLAYDARFCDWCGTKVKVYKQ